MAKTTCIEIGRGRSAVRIPVLYEDRSVLAVDKPAGWLLVPYSWDRTSRNLTAGIAQAVAARSFWVKSRNLTFLRHVHRLDGDTTGVLLFGKSLGAVDSYGELFESRRMAKVYLAVVEGAPRRDSWTCTAPLGRDPDQIGRMCVDPSGGKESETSFHVLRVGPKLSLIEAHPLTGRTHQIRLHLREAGLPVAGDRLYGNARPRPARPGQAMFPMGLRAVSLAYTDPFVRKPVRIEAPAGAFLRAFGFEEPAGAPVY